MQDALGRSEESQGTIGIELCPLGAQDTGTPEEKRAEGISKET